MKRLLSVLIIMVLSLGYTARADEGMWLLPLLEKLNMGKMTELGLKLSAEDIFSLNQPSIKDAIVIFGGGCTGEIVSSKGLLMTNHHCGYGQIQSHSTVENDYLKNGFWAMTMDEELPNPRLSATFLVRIEDVTDKVLANVRDGMSEAERSAAIAAAVQLLTREAVAGTHYRAGISSFYGGNDFYMAVTETFTDVRLVGAPPSYIGKYGHDTDNWEWPRHTGDFSIFRVYTGADGKPAQYSKENVPLKPKHYLPVSIAGVKENDFAMVLGYPGSTTRYMTSFEIDEVLSITHPNRIKIRGIRQEILMADMMADQKVNIQYASKYSGSSNYWKNSIGMKAGLERLNVKGDKELIEKEFNAWVNANPAKKQKYGEALNLIRNSVQGRAEFLHAAQYSSETFRTGSELINFAGNAGRLITALQSGDSQNIEKTIESFRGTAENFYKNYNPPTDQKSIKAMIKLYMSDVPAKYHPDFFSVINGKYKGNVDRYVDDMFAKSVFASEEKLNAFLAKPSLKTLEKDPAYLASVSINTLNTELSRNSNQFASDLNVGRRLWIAALKEMSPERTLYPDANFSMRLSYGSVLDYEPRDAVIYKHFTTEKGVLEKYKPGDYEFDLTQKFIDLMDSKNFGRYAAPEGYLPINFLTNNDITGGNSGSPVINANGELIGLAFDGNWEAMSGDVQFEPDLQRCINVDIRYVLWVIDIYAGAKHLIEEMTIVK
ncbi:MAG: S46 family peptidase [Bacteroidales bacterium]